MKKIRMQSIVHAYAADKSKKEKAYEVIIPCLDFKPELFSLQNAAILKYDKNRHIFKVKLYGVSFFILGDFYNYAGQKNDRYEISQHLNEYEKYYHLKYYHFERDGHESCNIAYYIREINGEHYEEDLKKRWSA